MDDVGKGKEMLRDFEDRLLAKQRVQGAVDPVEILGFFRLIFGNDVRFRVVILLAKREGACLSEISRNVGMSRKNLARHLEMLTQSGIVDDYSVGMRDRVYRLGTKYSSMRQLLTKSAV